MKRRVCPRLSLNIKGTDPEVKPEIRAAHEIFNVANGKDNTVLELVDLLNKIIGKNIKSVFLPVRVGDVFRTNADISKIKSKLGYTPKVGFEEGLRKTVDYFRATYSVWSKRTAHYAQGNTQHE